MVIISAVCIAFILVMFSLALWVNASSFAKTREQWRVKAVQRIGVPLSERGIQKPADVFEVGPFAVEAWKRAGLMAEDTPPIIRRQANLPGTVYTVSHPYMSTNRLVKGVDALVAQIPNYSARLEKHEGGVVTATLIRHRVE